MPHQHFQCFDFFGHSVLIKSYRCISRATFVGRNPHSAVAASFSGKIQNQTRDIFLR